MARTRPAQKKTDPPVADQAASPARSTRSRKRAHAEPEPEPSTSEDTEADKQIVASPGNNGGDDGDGDAESPGPKSPEGSPPAPKPAANNDDNLAREEESFGWCAEIESMESDIFSKKLKGIEIKMAVWDWTSISNHEFLKKLSDLHHEGKWLDLQDIDNFPAHRRPVLRLLTAVLKNFEHRAQIEGSGFKICADKTHNPKLHQALKDSDMALFLGGGSDPDDTWDKTKGPDDRWHPLAIVFADYVNKPWAEFAPRDIDKPFKALPKAKWNPLSIMVSANTEKLKFVG